MPANLIPEGATEITAEMLTLVQLSPQEIEGIVGKVAGGAGNVQDIYPLAPLQEGILFHHMMGQSGDAYLLPNLFSFASREALSRFLSTLEQVIARHDILRTAVVWEGLSEPVQVVLRKAALSVDEVSFDPAKGDIGEQLKAEYDPRRYRIDVSEAPLMRGFMAEDSREGRWLLLLLVHHLAIDHTTVELMMREAAMIEQGLAAELPRPVPFRNFVAQARLGVSEEEHEAFFRKLLGDIEEPTAPFGLLDVRGDGKGVGNQVGCWTVG